MSRMAWMYIIEVMLLGAIVSGLAVQESTLQSAGWGTFAAFLVLASVAQVFKVLGPTHDAYHINLVFLFAGVFLLNPFQYVLLVVIPHTIEWAKERLLKTRSLRNWYIQPVNMAVHIIAGLSAGWLRHDLGLRVANFDGAASVLVAFLCAVTYVLVNHVLIGEAIVLARKITWRESGILNAANIFINLVLLVLGYTVAVVWTVDPWLIIPALSPLVLMYRALTIPKLTKEAQTDAKTGLLNARYFMTLYMPEMEKAARLNRPLVLLMTDLDLLRNINNTYGHIAGDAVLAGVARIVRENIRSTDIAGRFGGEEFCIALPETSCQQALVIADRLCARVEAAEYTASTLAHPIRATVSIGLASFPSDATLPFDLIHKADIAVYQAKLDGRNRVVNTADVPGTIEKGLVPGPERAVGPASSTYVPRPVPH